MNETIVLDLERRVAYGLDDAAATVLSWLGSPVSKQHLLDAAGTLREAVASFLDTLQAEGLVVPTDGADVESSFEPLDNEPTLLWSEPLPELVQQASPPMEMGNFQCFQ